MEDRNLVVPFTPRHEERYAMYGVFDGHGGTLAVSHVYSFLHAAVVNSPSWKHGDTASALSDGFACVERGILKEAYEKGKMETGAAVALVVIRGNELFVANVGDVQAVLCRDSQGICLTTLHTPRNVHEYIRVEKSGGLIAHYRVHHPSLNGQLINLALTRSLGDGVFKLETFLRGKSSGVIGVPDVIQLLLRKSDEFLIIASDGFWDVVQIDVAVKFVKNVSCSNSDPAFICRELTQLAVVSGARDNITVILVMFTEASGARKRSKTGEK